MTIENKVALITGASRGIGQAIMLELAKTGVSVLGTATTQKGADNITAKLKELGFKGQGYVLDVSSSASTDEMLEKVSKDYGTVHILVNNAGITRDNLLMRMSVDEWDSVINTNLSSIYRLSKALLRPMMKARWGRIINISSVVGQMGNPGQTNYCAAKAGLVGFSKALAGEVASRNITVNVVAPGFIKTDMTESLPEEYQESLVKHIPAKRVGLPSEVAATVGFLATDSASYITGNTIHVNGGMYMA